MKKVLVVAAVLVAALVAVSMAHAQFGNIKVPTSASDAKNTYDNVEYDQCKSLANSYDNNTKWNSLNLPNELNSNKDLKFVKTSKDWKVATSKYDKEHKAWEAEYNYRTNCGFRANCTSEKCYVSCWRK